MKNLFITFFDDDDANDYHSTTRFCILNVQPVKNKKIKNSKHTSPELNPQNNTRQSPKRA